MFKNLKLVTRIGLGFAGVMALMGIAIIAVFIALLQVQGSVLKVNEQTLPTVLLIDEMDVLRGDVQQFLTDAAVTHEREVYEEAEITANSFRAAGAKFRQIFQRENDTDRLKAIDSLLADFKVFYDTGKSVAETYITEGREIGNLSLKGFNRDSASLARRLGEIRADVLAEANRASAETLTLSKQALWLMAIGGAIATILAAFVVAWLARSIIRQLGADPTYAEQVVSEIGSGNVAVEIKLAKGDSTSMLAAIKAMAVKLGQMISERDAVSAQIKKENDNLNDSVLNLLKGVAQLSRKDLTTKVTVAEDVTGAVADALNLLSSETAKVLQQVSDISADVTGASLKVKQQSDTVRETADEERQLIIQTAEDLRHAAEGMARIEQLAQSANLAADNAVKSTQSALATVSATVGGINSTRDIIRETEKRIKRLGERSQEISGVVGIINTIAERTHILALNASMHAASAGEAGRGFAVVAEEVQRLAESSRQATAQIATLVNNIQVETADTVNTMNSAITQVVDGSRLAEQAGEQMKLTQETTADLVASVRQIAASSQEQSQISAGLVTRSSEIRKGSERTSKELTEQAGQTENLVNYAKALLSSVRVFKLPA